MQVVYKMWLHDDGMAFGEGAYRLLEGIRNTGSLRQAALAMGMSYNKARNIIACCERNLGIVLITRTIGGRTGGCSDLTGRAIELMGRYDKFRVEVEAALAETYARHFDGQVAVVHKAAVRTRGRRDFRDF
jgi:molybdate transport system regulatory protein